MTKEEVKERIISITKGIDKTEIESNYGWWETAKGANFGKGILIDLLSLIDELDL